MKRIELIFILIVLICFWSCMTNQNAGNAGPSINPRLESFNPKSSNPNFNRELFDIIGNEKTLKALSWSLKILNSENMEILILKMKGI